MNMLNPKVKSVDSTSTVTFRNTAGSFYDMIISVQNQTINQSITILDTEGNLITENPIVLTVPAKVILKDVKIGSITFSDTNIYNVVVSYITKDTASGIPYVDIDYQNGYIYAQETGIPKAISTSFTNSTYSVSPPSGKKWILRNIMMTWEAAATVNDFPQVQIVPSGLDLTLVETTAYNLFYDSLAVTAGDSYIVDLARYVQSRSSQEIGSQYVTEQTVPGAFELYSNENLVLNVGNETNQIDVYVTYIEVNLG